MTLASKTGHRHYHRFSVQQYQPQRRSGTALRESIGREQSADNQVVFVKIKEGFQAVRVTVGARSAGRAEVISGLAPGQSIAGRGAFLLKGELNKGEAEHGH